MRPTSAASSSDADDLAVRPSASRRNADRLRLQAASREREDAARRRVQPLHVVDRDDHRGGRRERTKSIQKARRERAPIGRLVGRTQQQGDLERPSLRLRQARQRLLQHRLEQIDQAPRTTARPRSRPAVRPASDSRACAPTRVASLQSAVLPAPGSPSISSACGDSDATPSRNTSTRASSTSRPTSADRCRQGVPVT